MWFFFLNKDDFCGNYFLKSIISLYSDDVSQDLGDPIVNLLLVILKEKKVLFISPCLCPPSSFGSILFLGLCKQYPGKDFHGSKGVELLIDLEHIHPPSVLVSPMPRLWKAYHPHQGIGCHSLKLPKSNLTQERNWTLLSKEGLCSES